MFLLKYCFININQVLYLLFLFLSVITVSEVVRAEKHYILVLNSYHENIPWSQELMKGIYSVFDNPALNVQLCIEYMDNIRYPILKN
ncbi:hypothetical protein GMMP1_1480005 [Candidatus Magnetomoraceae bacterium gMMP-1]